jgi:hypothetical protein
MKKGAGILALATLLAATAAAPAMAVWMPVTAIPLDARRSVDVVDASRTLPDRVDAISLRADNTDVMCRSVEGYFRSGETMQLFSGFMPAGRENVIHMLPVHRDIARVDFHCHAANGGVGDIHVAANLP